MGAYLFNYLIRWNTIFSLARTQYRRQPFELWRLPLSWTCQRHKHKIMFKASKQMSLYLPYLNLEDLKLQKTYFLASWKPTPRLFGTVGFQPTIEIYFLAKELVFCLDFSSNLQAVDITHFGFYDLLGIHRSFPKVVNLIYFLSRTVRIVCVLLISFPIHKQCILRVWGFDRKSVNCTVHTVVFTVHVL